MATIEKRESSLGKTVYRVKVRLRGSSPETATFSRLTDAKRWASQTESAIREGRYFNASEAKKHTLAEAIDKYTNECLYNLKDPSHRLHHLKWWKNRLGHTALSNLSRALIVESRNILKAKSLSKATVNRYLASLSPVLTESVKEWGWMQSNPCLDVKRYKESDGRTRFLSDDERAALLDACNQFRDYPEIKIIVLIAITTGMRRGEIRGLRWRDVDFKRRRFTIVNTKNGDTRSVPLVDPAYTELMSWAKVRPLDDNAPVFAGHSERTKDHPLDFDKLWQDVRKLSGIEDFRFHDLRHTAASYLAMNGAGLREIGDILGHKTMAMVQRYSHLTDDHKHKTVERMTEAVFGGNK